MCSDPCAERMSQTFNFLYKDKCPSHICKNCENMLVLGTLAYY